MTDKDRYSDVRPGSVNPRGNFWLRFLMGAVVVFVVWYFFVRPDTFSLSTQEQTTLLNLARQQLTSTVQGDGPLTLDASQYTGAIAKDGAAFVSIDIGGALRGCMIDAFVAHEPLYVNVIHNTQLAAQADARFSPIQPDELNQARLTISVVYDIRSVRYDSPEDLLEKLEPFVDGVILTVDGEVATYLPVVWETFPDPSEFLSQLCLKAGWLPDRWRTEPYPEVQIYSAFVISES